MLSDTTTVRKRGRPKKTVSIEESSPKIGTASKSPTKEAPAKTQSSAVPSTGSIKKKITPAAKNNAPPKAGGAKELPRSELPRQQSQKETLRNTEGPTSPSASSRNSPSLKPHLYESTSPTRSNARASRIERVEVGIYESLLELERARNTTADVVRALGTSPVSLGFKLKTPRTYVPPELLLRVSERESAVSELQKSTAEVKKRLKLALARAQTEKTSQATGDEDIIAELEAIASELQANPTRVSGQSTDSVPFFRPPDHLVHSSKILSAVAAANQDQSTSQTSKEAMSPKEQEAASSSQNLGSQKARPDQSLPMSGSSRTSPLPPPQPYGQKAKICPRTTSPITPEPAIAKTAYKQASRKWIRVMVALPIAIVTSYVLFERLALGEERKRLVQWPGDGSASLVASEVPETAIDKGER